MTKVKRKVIAGGKRKKDVEAKKDISKRLSVTQLRIPDKEDMKILKGKSENYIMGWNKVKYKQSFEMK